MVADPSPDTYLNAVDALSADDVWAAGADTPVSMEDITPILLHWDGTSWQSLSLPHFQHGAELNGVKAFSDKDVWVVGFQYTSIYVYGDVTAIILHWDGGSWHEQDFPDPFLTGNELTGIAGRSSTDLWAVGVSEADTDLFLRWNGQTWRRLRTGHHLVFSTAVAIAPGGYWLLENHDAFRKHHDPPSLTVWDGETNQVTRTYRWGTNTKFRIDAVAPLSGTDVWLAGGQQCQPDGVTCNPFLLSWTNGKLKAVRTPLDQIPDSRLRGIAAASRKQIWVVGNHLLAQYTA